MEWNFDMSQAPKGRWGSAARTIGKNSVTVDTFEPDLILAAGSGGIVTVSKWLPKEERWNMFTATNPPIAWMPFPKHPMELK